MEQIVDDYDKIAYECDLLDAMNAALELRVVQVGYVKYVTDENDTNEKEYDLYRTLSDIPIYLIQDNGIKIIGIKKTFLENYTFYKSIKSIKSINL